MMTSQEVEKAKSIFAKSAEEWTKEDRNFLQTMFDKGHRETLKKLRAA